jgi:AraC-like DNA-binding protein
MPNISSVLLTYAEELARLEPRFAAAKARRDAEIVRCVRAAGPYTVSDVAATAGVSRPTLYKLLHQAGELDNHKL